MIWVSGPSGNSCSGGTWSTGGSGEARCGGGGGGRSSSLSGAGDSERRARFLAMVIVQRSTFGTLS